MAFKDQIKQRYQMALMRWFKQHLPEDMKKSITPSQWKEISSQVYDFVHNPRLHSLLRDVQVEDPDSKDFLDALDNL